MTFNVVTNNPLPLPNDKSYDFSSEQVPAQPNPLPSFFDDKIRLLPPLNQTQSVRVFQVNPLTSDPQISPAANVLPSFFEEDTKMLPSLPTKKRRENFRPGESISAAKRQKTEENDQGIKYSFRSASVSKLKKESRAPHNTLMKTLSCLGPKSFDFEQRFFSDSDPLEKKIQVVAINRMLPQPVVQEVILELLTGSEFQCAQIAHCLSRTAETIHKRYLECMLESGEIVPTPPYFIESDYAYQTYTAK